MQQVIINMQSAFFADMISRKLSDDGDFEVTAVDDPRQTAEQCKKHEAGLVLLEVTGRAPYRIEDRLRIREELRQSVPKCRIVLVVDEKTEKESAAQVKQAKRDGLIDLFLFESASATFAAALMDTL